jgi:hypothetical protein
VQAGNCGWQAEEQQHKGKHTERAADADVVNVGQGERELGGVQTTQPEVTARGNVPEALLVVCKRRNRTGSSARR